MKRAKLDEIDLKIVGFLQDDGRMTNVELAGRIGISAPPCLRRVRAIEQQGVIRGYHADVAPAALGYTSLAIVQVLLVNHAEGELRKFEELVESWPEVRECYMVAGEVDYILKIVAGNWDEYQRFLTSRLVSAPNIRHVRSAVCMRTAFVKVGVPVQPNETSRIS